jgi:hypothetical protein
MLHLKISLTRGDPSEDILYRSELSYNPILPMNSPAPSPLLLPCS